MPNIFTKHPHEVDETYLEHLATAGGFGLRMTLGGIACMIHAVLPFLFVNTASRTMCALHKKMNKRVDKVNWERHPII
ncbi:MAG: DUF6356 family protein [Allosphingosinicella sp.]|uniref:DUF6356 family protein n=1 Tax=Allosphingosinicella sp. TaxID=2823234 RepID=UPI00394A8AFE